MSKTSRNFQLPFPTPLVPARLIRRYKRFLADCRLEDGSEIVAHCANPGSMLGLAEPGARIWIEPTDQPGRKLKFGWRLVELDGGQFVGVDTSVPNRLLRGGFEERAVRGLGLDAYVHVRPEVRVGDSRLDFLLSGSGLPDAYVEVKSVTLSRTPGLAEFPDSVTARGARHLETLSELARSGSRAVMLFLVQRTDAKRFAVAADIDPAYACGLRAARDAGVEVLALGTRIAPEVISIGNEIPAADS